MQTYDAQGRKKVVQETSVTGSITGDVISMYDQKSAGTAGGTFTSGAWRTRDLNSKPIDTGSHCTLSSNQFTLTAGTYEIWAACPAYGVEQHISRLQNITDSSTTLTGTSTYGTSSGVATTGEGYTHSFIAGRFTIAASKTFEIQHRCQQTLTTNGWGVPSNQGISETYTAVQLRKVEAGGNLQETTADVIVLRDEKSSGTNGGTFTTGAWRTRDLNSKPVDTGSHCTLSSNQFTLLAGTYEITAIAPAVMVEAHMIRLYNATDAVAVPNISGSMYASSGAVVSNYAILIGRFTLSTTKAMEIQHWGNQTKTTDGFGVKLNQAGVTEVYTQVWLRRVA